MNGKSARRIRQMVLSICLAVGSSLLLWFGVFPRPTDVIGQGDVDLPRIVLASSINSLNQPARISHTGDGSRRLFVAGQGGTIQITNENVPLDASLLHTPSLTPPSTWTPLQTSTANPDTSGVFRPSNGALFLKNQNTTGFADLVLTYGLPGDQPIAGDWNGDGIDTIGVYRNGVFFLRNSNTNGFADIVFVFGLPTDQAVAGDWNGDGMDTIGLYRDGIFILRNTNSTGNADAVFVLGIPGDVGIAGDWDGDGMDTTGVFRPSNGALFLKNQNTTGFADIVLTYGLPGDKPVTGDWNGDRTDTIGVYRNGTFFLRNSNTNGFADIVFTLGIPGDEPIAGDWDGLP